MGSNFDYSICEYVYEYLGQKFGLYLTQNEFAALRVRMKSLLANQDPYKIYVLVSKIVEDKGSIFELKHLSWGAISLYERSLNIPDKAWKYMYASEIVDLELQRKFDYWLGKWIDNQEVDDALCKKAEKKLKKLMEKIEWI